MAPGTEFARNFCAGIGPLQLGVVLVISIVSVGKKYTKMISHMLWLYQYSLQTMIKIPNNHK